MKKYKKQFNTINAGGGLTYFYLNSDYEITEDTYKLITEAIEKEFGKVDITRPQPNVVSVNLGSGNFVNTKQIEKIRPYIELLID